MRSMKDGHKDVDTDKNGIVIPAIQALYAIPPE